MTNETMTTWQRQERQAQTFIAALQQLDAGGRARLKRNAGRPLTEARDIHRVFFQALPNDVDPRQDDIFFLIATLFPLVPHRATTGNLGASLRQVRLVRSTSDNQMNSLDRRFQALLDSDREQLRFRLGQAVRLIAAERDQATLNWEQLLRDVLQWEHPDHYVQLRWARDYFVGSFTQSYDTKAKGDRS